MTPLGNSKIENQDPFSWPLEFPYDLSSIPLGILCPQPFSSFDVWFFSGIAHYDMAALDVS